MVLIFLLTTFALGQVARISFINQLVNFYPYEIILVFYLSSLIFKYKLKPIKESYKKFKYFYWLLGIMFFSTILSSLSFSFYQNIVAILYLLRPTLYFLFFIYSIPTFKKLETQYKKSLSIFIWITLIASAIQYIFYPNLRNLYYLGWDPHYFRAFGLFFEPAVAAAIFGLLMIKLYFENKTKLSTYLLGSFGILGLLTYARGFYLAAAATVLTYLVKNKFYKQLLAFLIAFAVAILIVPKPAGEGGNLGRTSTIHSRLVDYQQGVNLWKTNPILGVGYNHLPFLKQSNDQVKNTADHSKSAFQSTYLTILITTGIIGLIIFLLTLNQLAGISVKAFYYTLFLAVFSLIDNIFLQPFVFFLFFYLLLSEVSRADS